MPRSTFNPENWESRSQFSGLIRGVWKEETLSGGIPEGIAIELLGDLPRSRGDPKGVEELGELSTVLQIPFGEKTR